MVRFGATPEVNAASTVLIVVTVVLTLIAMQLQRPAQAGQPKV
jgi:spermidine/putrescine transport system permease protein